VKHKIGIRREDKNKWERRVPLIPDQVETLIREKQLSFAVQPSPIRVFSDEEYEKAGAEVRENLDDCGIVFAVKEIPSELFREGGTYAFFSHTVKGQPYNMDMLRRLIELKCNIIDYERVTDERNQRLIFFGRYAGIAGMIDTLWAFGKRMAWEELEPNPFLHVKQAYQYNSLDDAIIELDKVAIEIKNDGLCVDLCPLIIGITGYGNVSLGAQEIIDILPFETLDPAELDPFISKGGFNRHKLYKVVFKEEHMVMPADKNKVFDLEEYYEHPDRYVAAFDRYFPQLTVLMNCIYWDDKYPRLITRSSMIEKYSIGCPPPLKVVGDISCDIEGAVEFTGKATYPDNPVFVYEPARDRITDGVKGDGPVVMAVDNLPCELSREASIDFGKALFPFIEKMAGADFTVPFSDLRIPVEIKKAMIVYQGKLTPDYRHMDKFISKS